MDPSQPKSQVLSSVGTSEDASAALVGLLARGEACDPGTIRALHAQGADLRAHTLARTRRVAARDGTAVPSVSGAAANGSAFWLALTHCDDITAAKLIVELDPFAAEQHDGKGALRPELLAVVAAFRAPSATQRAPLDEIDYALRTALRSTKPRQGVRIVSSAVTRHLKGCGNDDIHALCRGDEGKKLLGLLLDARRDLDPDGRTLHTMIELAMTSGHPGLALQMVDEPGALIGQAGRHDPRFFLLSLGDALEVLSREDADPANRDDWNALRERLAARGIVGATGEELEARLERARKSREVFVAKERARAERRRREARSRAADRRASEARATAIQECVSRGGLRFRCEEDPAGAAARASAPQTWREIPSGPPPQLHYRREQHEAQPAPEPDAPRPVPQPQKKPFVMPDNCTGEICIE